MKVRRRVLTRRSETALAREARLDHEVSDALLLDRWCRWGATAPASQIRKREIVSVIKFDLSTRLETRTKEFSI